MKILMVLRDKHEVTIDDAWRIDKSIGVKYKGCKVIIVIVLSKMKGGERGGITCYKGSPRVVRKVLILSKGL